MSSDLSFLIEFSVIGKGITGVFASVYDLLGGLTLLCAASCFYLSVKPAAFFCRVLVIFWIGFEGHLGFANGFVFVH